MLAKVNGPLGLAGPAVPGGFSGTFTNFVFTDNRTAGNDVVTLAGQVDSGCFGSAVTYSTPTALTIPAGMACPSGGALLVSAKGVTDRIGFTGSGGVEIDLGNTGGPDQTFTTCTDADLSCR